MVNILVLCTGNSARSIMAEALFNRLGGGRIRAFSAGSKPKHQPHPHALQLLTELGYDTTFARSKSWDEFAGDETPSMDYIFTVCGNAARETCPIWPGHPAQTHWGIDDPADAKGSEAEIHKAFIIAYGRLEQRVAEFMQLPFDSVKPEELKPQLVKIGDMG